jgi:hypothetical protein
MPRGDVGREPAEKSPIRLPHLNRPAALQFGTSRALLSAWQATDSSATRPRKPMSSVATPTQPAPTAAVAVLSVLKSHDFRQAYHQAVDQADVTPAAQQTTVRSIIEAYFDLEEIAPTAPLHAGSVYFTEEPVEVHGHAKFLVPGDVHRDLIPGSLFLLTPKAPLVERLIEAKEFGGAISAVEAVRLTLIPERVNGIVSFIADAKQYYAHNDVVGAERAVGAALDHMNRAAADGLRRIESDAERGKRSNEVAGTRRKLANLRMKLQKECIARAESKPHGAGLLHAGATGSAIADRRP